MKSKKLFEEESKFSTHRSNIKKQKSILESFTVLPHISKNLKDSMKQVIENEQPILFPNKFKKKPSNKTVREKFNLQIRMSNLKYNMKKKKYLSIKWILQK